MTTVQSSSGFSFSTKLSRHSHTHRAGAKTRPETYNLRHFQRIDFPFEKLRKKVEK